MTRTQAREQAFIILFEKSFNLEVPIEEIFENAVDARDLMNDDYIMTVVNSTFDNLQKIDDSISENLSKWTIDRISRVSLAILRLSVCEMQYIDDVPNSVSINEAVELAKKYSTSEEASYINGVLGTISRKLGD
ncbi:MAG: transcription antitermination factor NusB [Oscillospiraceae bacterium]